MLDCLKDIVGVLKDANPIITSGIPEPELTELQKSTSGLFLDELPGGVHMKALKYTDVAKPFSTMAKGALELAKKNLEDDLIVSLKEKYNKSRSNFNGQVGQLSYATSFQPNRRYQGIRIAPVDYIDADITVSRITSIFNGAASFQLMILAVPINSVMGTEINTVQFDVLPNNFKTVEFLGEDVLRLPFLVNNDLMEYWFVYDTVQLVGVYPKDMQLGCRTCGGKNALNDYAIVSGVELESLANLSARANDNLSHGLILDVQISCNTQKIFCREYKNDDAVAVTMAYAVWHKAGELLIEEVMKSPDVNRYTTQAREYLWGKRNHFRVEYQDRIKYLSATIDVQSSNCYVCSQRPNQPLMGRILS